MTDDQQGPFEVEPPDEAEEVEAPPRSEPTGIAWGAILLLLGVALVVVFAVQNTEPVPVKFLWMEGQFPLSIVVLVTIGVIILLTEVIAVSYRKRRRRRQAEKEELRKYRGA
jgi:uncharacterized integral membrane protein